jgi:nucleotide-binding universal stress UspA family protein
MKSFNFTIKKILVPIDFSENSMKALDNAIYMAKLSKAGITLIHNTEVVMADPNPGGYFAPSLNNYAAFEKDMFENAKNHLKKLAEKIEKKNKIKVTSITTSGWIREQILNTAEKIKADIIVMGTHGTKGLREFIMGSNAFRIVNEAKCPVLSIHPQTKTPGFKNILLPFRGKRHSREKVDYAIKIAEMYGSTIHVLGIDTENSKSDKKKIELEAEQIKDIIEKHGLKCKIKVESAAFLSEKVLKYSKKIDADLIVIMADLDKMRISEYFMGPFAQQIVNHSPIPVLSIKPTFNPNTVELHGYGW